MQFFRKRRTFTRTAIMVAICFYWGSSSVNAQRNSAVFARENLVAWCIVPFDAAQRTPAERADMLNRLGIRQLAYDWRDENIPEFDEEVKQLESHGIAMTAFWWRGGLPQNRQELEENDLMKLQMDFFKRNDLKLNVWLTCTERDLVSTTDEGRYEEIADRIDDFAAALDVIGCRLELYNHGGWGGEPRNLVKIMELVDSENTGIVYNFHHAHEHLDEMPAAFEEMLPYLSCVNLNGMTVGGPKILPPGTGQEDGRIIRMIMESGYGGPIGIIGHIADKDVEQVLKRNLEGLDQLLRMDFGRRAREYADHMLAKGKDHYGPVHAPVFVSMLNRSNDSIFKEPKATLAVPRRVAGYREIDRAWNAANPYTDEALYTLLYQLTEDREDEQYKDAADASLKWYISHTQHPVTGLIPWGEHLAWRVDSEKVTRHYHNVWSDRKHETSGYWKLWEKVFELEPDRMIRYAEGIWKYHVTDKVSGLHAHQTRYDTCQADTGIVWPRMAGTMVYLWSLAYQTTSDPKVKVHMADHIHTIITTHNERRIPGNRALIRLHPDKNHFYAPASDLAGMCDMHQSLGLAIPDTLKRQIRRYLRFSDDTYLSVQEKVRRGMVWQADSFLNIKRVDSSNFWCMKYGQHPLAETGMHVALRYDQTGNPGYLGLVMRIAREYIDQDPYCESFPLWPKTLSVAIDLMLKAHQISGEAIYHQKALEFGQVAQALFMDKGSPLPRVLDDLFDHYETITGGADLMLSFYRLSQVK